MTEIIPKKYKIDDLSLQKSLARQKITKIIDFASEQSKKPLIKTASNNSGNSEMLIQLFTQMLACLNLKTSDSNVKEIITALSEKANGDLNKQAAINKKERKDEIKIASKRIKDSHYQVDVSKDLITHDGKKMHMVSCYARDAYLGRYLIKRNYFFTEAREAAADEAYDEIMTKMAALKNRYYNEVIGIEGMSMQMKKILDGVISEIESNEDTVATNIKR